MKWPQKKRVLTETERNALLKKAHYNLFALDSSSVFIDLLTDSGTGRMSAAQWKALRNGDESYAGSMSAKRLRSTIRKVFCMPYVRLVHQGRAAEDIFNSAVLTKPGMLVFGNTPFDTTRAHIESRGGIIVDCTNSPAVPALDRWKSFSGFLGNVDLDKFAREIKRAKEAGKKIAYALITATCNSTGGHAVSLDNIRRASRIAHKLNIPIFMDLARYAENAYFIKKHGEECSHLSIDDVLREISFHIDGMLVSGKKDALGNMGGFLAFKSQRLSQEAIERIILFNVMREGLDGKERFDTMDEKNLIRKLLLQTLTAEEEAQIDFIKGYGGMSGRDMETLNQGIKESLDEIYLGKRIGQVDYLIKRLYELGIPILPPGGHAAFVDAGKLLPHISWEEFPGHALALALYREGGIRTVEVGSLMLGRDPENGKNRRAPQELTRLAIPRRLYTKTDMDYVVSVFEKIKKNLDEIRPVNIKDETKLRHFDSTFC